MPFKRVSICGFPCCPNTTERGRYCVKHAPKEARETSHRRGYDSRWKRLRTWFLANHPLCVDPFNVHNDNPVPAEHIDHIIRFKGTDDPLRLDPTNLQALCQSCHSIKTQREQKNYG